jgi:protein SCO1/2
MPLRVLILLAGLAIGLAAKSYRVDGVVVAVDKTARTMLVSHRPIENYMGAMTMPFRVEDADQLEGLHPGMRVRFELLIKKDDSVARNVRKSGDPDQPIPPPAQQLKIGEVVPDVALTDQLGRVVRFSDFKGKVIALDFIYTRCPLPDVCPRLSANFAALQKRFRSGVVLLSITVDPEYDTPPVLAEYANRWGADHHVWRFLTGDVSRIAPLLGEVYWADEGTIGHNSTTCILDREGRLAAMLEGSAWRLDQLENLVSYQLDLDKDTL